MKTKLQWQIEDEYMRELDRIHAAALRKLVAIGMDRSEASAQLERVAGR